MNSLNITPDGRTFIFASSSMATPTEIFAAATQGVSIKALSRSRPSYTLPAPDDVSWTGAAQTPIHGFLLKPANFDAKKKYPLLVLIHGGPQGAWSDNWGYRWNPQVFSNAGYVVFMPNQRGSTGYGRNS